MYWVKSCFSSQGFNQSVSDECWSFQHEESIDNNIESDGYRQKYWGNILIIWKLLGWKPLIWVQMHPVRKLREAVLSCETNTGIHVWLAICYFHCQDGYNGPIRTSYLFVLNIVFSWACYLHFSFPKNTINKGYILEGSHSADVQISVKYIYI